jgi:RimJ/RimL family protein N-acetyltransferase
MLFVHPRAGGRGVARTLLATVKEEAARRGLTRLHTFASRSAKPAFERSGFTVVTHRPRNTVRGVEVPNYEMRCELAARVSFAAKPTLRGTLVTLRPVQRSDAAQLAAVDPETLRLTGTHRTFTLSDLEQWYATRGEQTDRVDWAIVENATGRWAGEAVLNDLDPDNRSCGFRILLQGPEFYGRGLGSEATRLAVEHAFTTGVHRVELEVYDFNPRARRVYEKAGFRHEGTKREALHWDGRWIDAHLMALLATDRADGA